MSSSHRPLHGGTEASRRLMTKVARMYHERGIRQVDIAAALHLSQAKVSRLLKQAVDLGIVRTIVEVAPGVHPELEEALELRFGLLEAVVVDVETDDVADEADILAALGSAAVGYLEATLTGGDRIGISSWSETLLAMVDRLRPFRTGAAEEVVQLVGGIGVPRVQRQAGRLVGEFAQRLGAEPFSLQAPGVVADHGIRDSLLADPALAEVTGHWNRLTLALVGIGSIEPSPLLAQIGNAIPPADLEVIAADGAVGDICHHFFTADGTPVSGDLESRLVAIPIESFLAIPRRVGLAGGPRKLDAVRAALTGGWVNVIMTDLTTAQSLLTGSTRAETTSAG